MTVEAGGHHGDAVELFHRIADSESAAVRRLILELDLKDEIDFRNVDTGETAADDWRARGGRRVPALWTGEEMIEGLPDIEEYLRWAIQEPHPELLADFDRIAGEVWDELKKIIPPEFEPTIAQIRFIVLDEPPQELLDDLPEELAEFPEELCGLHVGTPITKNSIILPDPMPARVYLFRWALMDQIEPDDEDPEGTLREEIAVTLLHEVGHYFGLEEEDLERLGYD